MFLNNFGKFENVECGLISLNSGLNKYVPIPLTSVSITASVVHAVAQVEITQVYQNNEKIPIEAIYFFPVDSNGAVTHFQAELDGKIIKGIVKENEAAKIDYENAVNNHQTAFLGEENKPDIFKVSVGYLKPGKEVKVIIGYVTEVKNDPDSHAIRFSIPTTVAPRYVPNPDADEKSAELANMHYNSLPPAPLDIKVIVSLQGEIKSVESPSKHNIVKSLETIPDKSNWKKAIVKLAGNVTEMDRDFVLLVTPSEPLSPRIYSEVLANGSTTLMIHFIPSFKLDEQKSEFVFLIDRSGSMGGSSISMAKQALKLCLHSLPPDCYFNICGFGSSHEFLFPNGSKKYDGKTLGTGMEYTGALDADMGGTEILFPLKEILSKPKIPGYLRQVFVLTDGEVGNTEEIIGLVKANSQDTRLFTLGIGTAASHYLVEGIAKAGGGTCAFVESGESIQTTTLSQLKNALQPSLTDVTVEWQGLLPEPTTVLNKEKTLCGYNKPINAAPGETCSSNPTTKKYVQAPKNIPPIFDGAQMLVFGVFPPNEQPTGAKVTAETPDGPLTLDLTATKENDVGSTGMLHRLAAIQLVRGLEIEELSSSMSLKQEIIGIAVEHGIASKYTSFVAVDENCEKMEYEMKMQTRFVPSQIPRSWHGPDTLCAAGAPRFLKIHGGGGNCDMLEDRYRGVVACSKSFADYGVPSKAFSSLGSSLNFSKKISRALALVTGTGKDSQPVTAPDSVVVHEIIKLQSFDGSFELDENLSKVIGIDLNIIKKESSKQGWDTKAWATTLAIIFLTVKKPKEKDLWELVVLKAEKWTAKHYSEVKENMVEAAKQCFADQERKG